MTLSITVQANEWASYALVYNRIPFVHTVQVDDIGHDAPAVLHVRLEDRGVALTHPFATELEPDADGSATVDPVQLQVDVAAMSQVAEDVTAQLVVEVHQQHIVTSHRQDVLLGSARTWRTIFSQAADGRAVLNPLATETLAAFVQPNDPSVGAFLDAVRARLEGTTGSGSTQGYQAGPERVDAIVRAIWDEARERGITYSNPPASWSAGQKVRTPEEVLDGRVGTCLDTSVVLAAAIEHAGLHPVLFIVEGHAFLGYWRTEELGFASVEALESAVNAVDSGRLRILETTSVTGGPDSCDFDDDVHQVTRGRYLSGDLSRFEGVVDVRVVRAQSQVLPLPAHRVESSGAATLVEYVPTEHSGHHVVSTTPQVDERTGAVVASVPPRVQSWKNALLDLSLRNKLINFTERSAIQLAVAPGSIGHVEDLLSAGQAVTLLPGDAVPATSEAQGVRFGADLPASQLKEYLDTKRLFTDVRTGQTLDTYLRRMRNLAYKARTIEEETGANNLYLALGSLHWQLDDRPLKSPLILLPVLLVPGSRRGLYRLQLDESGASTPNYCLIEKLRQVDGIRIPGLENPPEDEHGIDLAATFEAVREVIIEKDLPYRVEESADVAILQFAKFRLWKDLDDDWEGLMDAPLVRHLVENPTGEFEDPHGEASMADLDELDASCPIPADASQLEAVAAAVAGHTFVLEGPPGTGKSQTITNLLARAIASGKRVLFVAEKRAALDVVSSRLESVGMGPFSLDLHDKSSKPAVVRDQIKQALDLHLELDRQGLTAEQESVSSSRRALQRYATRLHERNTAGLSYYSARTQLLAYPDDLPALPITPEELTSLEAESLSRLRGSLRHLEDTADLARPQQHHPWGFVRRAVDDRRGVLAAAADLDRAVAELPPAGPLRDAVDQARTLQDLSGLVSLVHGPAVTAAELDEVRTRSWVERRDAYVSTLSALAGTNPPALERVAPAALDLPVDDVRDAVVAAAASGFFGRKKRVLAALAPLDQHLKSPVKPKEAPALLEQLVGIRAGADAVAPERSGVTGTRPVVGWNPFQDASLDAVEHQLQWLQVQAAFIAPGPDGAITPFGETLRALLDADLVLSEKESSALRALETAARDLWSASGSSDRDVQDWLDDAAFVPVWTTGVTTRSNPTQAERSLDRWLAFVSAAAVLRELHLDQAFDAVLEGRVGSTSAVASLEKGLALASTQERMLASGLDGFDAEAHGTSVRRFATSMVDLRAHLQQSVAADVLAARPFRSGSEKGQVGELRRQLERRRGGMKVRELLATYGDLVTQVMPCVLVSPDSIARFFPVGSITFDLVVFDEASQIRVADAVGAMGRATSAVVVGDSKQMPPTSFAEPGTDDAATVDDLLVQPDEESILTEVAQAGVGRRALTWHYRSKDESLIAFSNEHYYESRLSSFPAPDPGLDDEGHPVAGVSLVKLDGTFVRTPGRDKGTNRAEAEAIVTEIRRRFAASPGRIPSVGVVTFNMPQRTLVESMLRDLDDARILEAMDGTNGEGLFVKNLENVQGDERDVILFSTAFSRNDKGVLPLNFGPLTNRGGERRLNVAITRARTQVVIFTSFDPSELRVDATGSIGIKHLAAYMHAAAARTSGADQTSHRAVVDRHRDEIAEACREAGLVVTTDLGLSDFKIDLALAHPAAPDSPLVAVLLDGEGWAARRTVGDRDGLPVSVLENLMGWRSVQRVWMPEWLEDRGSVVRRLVDEVDTARTAPRPVPDVSQPVPSMSADVERDDPQQGVPERPQPASSVAANVVTDPSPASHTFASVTQPSSLAEQQLTGAEPFRPWAPRKAGPRSTLDALPGHEAAQKVAQVLRGIAEQEGPVSDERAARLTAGAFDLTRLNAARIESIVRCIPRAMRDDEGFAWPMGVDRATWTTFRTATLDDPRPVADIHPIEIGNAIVALCRDAHGMTQDELLKETLLLFGWRRRTDALTTPVLAALRRAQDAGRVVLGADEIVRAVV
ncbi:hypothetical protein QE370_002893 [Aeromicrobium sp. SORGH_AS981]|uniref:DUF4011 domain-containing protein n=1 Tax=Aeromicrobium sp. SORGH_AS_0981 TaxID=3041802 RepID=UPI00285D8C92|nr:DUF4011 domain-containing protein [Aeromicrobium sp. SORGH_AS_0981]MDR6119709.1 hypothetical protein [Aeromicrobium sp. SORGH_AS_0981]